LGRGLYYLWMKTTLHKYRNLFLKTSRRNALISVVILIIALVLTIFASYIAKSELEDQTGHEFALINNDIKNRILSRLTTQALLLQSCSSFISASDTVTWDDWKYFIQNSKISQNTLGYQGIGLNIITHKEVNLQQKIKKENGAIINYSKKPIAKNDVYTSIIYLEPYTKENQKAIGYDTYSEPVRRYAMRQARDHNMTTLTGKLTLVQEDKSAPQAGVIMYAPVYKRNLPLNTVDERQTAIVAWVSCPYRMNDLMGNILNQSDTVLNNIHLRIYDCDSVSNRSILYDSKKHCTASHDPSDLFTLDIPMEFNGRKWILSFFRHKAIAPLFQGKVFIVLSSGCIISLLLFYLSLLLFSTRYRAKKIAEQLTVELNEKNNEIETQNEEFRQLNEELNETNLELVQAMKRAEESDRLKTAFLQNMSHEIRTPMNAVMGFSELLVENFDDKENLEYFTTIINQRCNDLLLIIDEILDISKIESGQLSVTKEQVNLLTLFNDLKVMFEEIQFKNNKQHIFFDLRAQCDPSFLVIETDRMKLKQIFINLLGNAFKFTENGHIEAGCKTENGKLLFFVSDTGFGIHEDKQQVIFERFSQIEHATSQLYGGTGLGLSIVKGFIDALGGEIWLESEIGKGSTFYFYLS
jgi:signal transduction histidine kinase/sensor domain CHASE-containing protein